MKRVRSRLATAGGLTVAVVGSATGGVIAQADNSAPRAQAAQQGGVQITPATVERTARRGAVGSFTVKNSTRDTLRVTVTVRPWTQNRTTAAVSANLRASLTPYVRASPQTFDLRPGLAQRAAEHAPADCRAARSTVASRSSPSRKRRKGPQRDHSAVQRHRPAAAEPVAQAPEPARRRHRRAHAARPTGAVRNIVGNTLDPVGGSVRITGPTARTATVPQVGVVPGQVVYLKGGSTRGMRRGSYTATWSLTRAASATPPGAPSGSRAWRRGRRRAALVRQ